ncbi:MAG: galactokinase [Chloroflexi bacterium]|nr:galactokinase [Chloroflexota bacterium]
MADRETVLKTFEERFGAAPELLARAPGRVNLIGEHTDYNDGFVLPAAINRAIFIAARPRPDRAINLYSSDFEEQATFNYDNLRNDNLPGWTRYIRGALWWLSEQGHTVPGFDAVVGGNIPIASGLSSSAAIEVVTLEMALTLAGVPMEQRDKALAGVEVEHQFIGMPCGVMDQMASAMGVAGHALLIDCRSLETKPIPVPQGISMVIMNTKKARGLVDSEYAQRREQCEQAARILGVKALRDANLELLEGTKDKLDDVLYRRARHIITENRRVQVVSTILSTSGSSMSAQHGLRTTGQAMRDSHASLRDDYEVSCTELDVMADLANAQPGCFGARMTGAGFGGCAVALVEHDKVDDFVSAVAPAYEQKTGLTPELYVCEAAAGSGVEQL